MNFDLWIFLLLHLAWCGVVFSQGTLFGVWLADWHYWRGNRKSTPAQGGEAEPKEDAK